MKKIVIMGASSGIGYHLAHTLASRGVKVGLAARRTAELEKLKKEFPEFVEYEGIDINHKDAPHKLDELIAKIGGMDIYLHCSGIGYDNPELDPEREAEIIITNSAGFARMLSSAYNHFKRNGGKGQIAAITSVAGINGIGVLSAYSASKKCAQTYMVALEQLAHMQKLDIAFTDIRPGWVETPLLKETSEYPMEMTLEELTPQILKAIVKKKRVAVIDTNWKVVAGLWKLVPDSMWTKMDVSVSKEKNTINVDIEKKLSIGWDGDSEPKKADKLETIAKELEQKKKS